MHAGRNVTANRRGKNKRREQRGHEGAAAGGGEVPDEADREGREDHREDLRTAAGRDREQLWVGGRAEDVRGDHLPPALLAERLAVLLVAELERKVVLRDLAAEDADDRDEDR